MIEQKFSSVHHLFSPEAELDDWKERGFKVRISHQYHWINKGYEDFSSFLADLKGKRAKEIRREEKSVWRPMSSSSA